MILLLKLLQMVQLHQLHLLDLLIHHHLMGTMQVGKPTLLGTFKLHIVELVQLITVKHLLNITIHLLGLLLFNILVVV